MQSAAVRNLDNQATQYAVARDLARFDPRARVREAVQEAPTYQRAVSAPKAKAIPRAYMRLSPISVASFLGAAALLLLIVFSCMQISVINLENSRLNKELSELRAEEKKLTGSNVGVTASLSEIESYALYGLGMVKPDREHIVYIDLSGEDHGVAYEEEDFAETVGKAVSGFWTWLCDVFG